MDVSDLRTQLPVLEEVLYANAAAGTPCPEPVIDAMTRCLHRHSTITPAEEGLYSGVTQTKHEARDRLAGFLNVSGSELALTQSTADSVTRLATSLPWQPGDVVVQTDIEHPATSLPFQWLRDRQGIQIEEIETTDGQVDLDDLAETARNAALVMVDSITWTHGTKLRISEIADVVHDAGARLLVDAVQSVGQTTVDISAWNADFVVGSSHKWLLGPWGAGFLFVRDELEDLIQPTGISHWSVEDKWEAEYRLKRGAHKLEIGGSSPAPYAGLVTAINTMESMGVSAVESHIRELSQAFKQGFDPKTLLSPREFHSGIITVSPPNRQPIADSLSNQQVVVREVPLTPTAFRISLHGFNTMDDVITLARIFQ
jgi:selenocysteine lyase/cysteine desulfurase